MTPRSVSFRRGESIIHTVSEQDQQDRGGSLLSMTERVRERERGGEREKGRFLSLRNKEMGGRQKERVQAFDRLQAANNVHFFH